MKVNNWVVLHLDMDRTGSGEGAYWICECQCENKTLRSLSGVDLRRNDRRKPISCGCVPKKLSKQNKYDLTGQFGIGYTEKNESFYFDIDDYNTIKDYYWYINSKGYVTTRRNNQEIKMHRLIMNVDGEFHIDHINHIENDNRKENLRIVTHDQNMKNKVLYKNNTSGVPGVTWNKRDQKWVARIQTDRKQIELGRFYDFNDAVKARQDAEIRYYGEYRCKLNYT